MKKNGNKGITLIALVITIIVLLILAGVSISLVVGDNGVLNESTEAADKTDIAETREQIESELVGRYDNKGNYTNADVIEAVKAVTGKTVEEGAKTVATAKGNEVDISDLWGEIVETISKEQSYVGYYADMDGDKTPDGIIYADLLCGPFEGTWGSYTYSISSEDQITSSKDYYIISQGYSGNFGTNDVIAPTGSGDERFYVMALEDYSSTYTWYGNAVTTQGYYDTTVALDTSTKFGTGKDNTSTMITRWDNLYFGTQSSSDVWGAIKGKVENGWFLPSKDEWVAFAFNLGVTKENYTELGLRSCYWSSSQFSLISEACWDCRRAWCTTFDGGYMYSNGIITGNNYVRLSTTF